MYISKGQTNISKQFSKLNYTYQQNLHNSLDTYTHIQGVSLSVKNIN